MQICHCSDQNCGLQEPKFVAFLQNTNITKENLHCHRNYHSYKEWQKENMDNN